MRPLLASLGVVFLSMQPVGAQDIDLELVLMADSTGSITDEEIAFQRQGYATALTDPAVLKAIGSAGLVAMTYVEWGQSDSQQIVAPWTLIDSEAAARDFAAAILAQPRLARGRNGIGAALIFGRDLLEANDLRGFRRIIDFSADSTGNFNGPSIEEGRAAALAAGITINGLAVACRDCTAGTGNGADLETAFAERIIGGPGAFVVTADSPAVFADAVRRKLILEISGGRPAVPDGARAASDARLASAEP